MKQLNEAGPMATEFTRRAEVLGNKLGVLLFQLPPYMKKDLSRLRDLLAALPRARRAALEFRHDSWRDDETYKTLEEHGAALCVADTDEGDTPFVSTADFAYLRLRRTRYDEKDLRGWVERIGAQEIDRAYVYFKHEDEGLATRFADELTQLWRVEHGDAPAERG
jgi:uncharacterized protein YecE (DUF72 family)